MNTKLLKETCIAHAWFLQNIGIDELQSVYDDAEDQDALLTWVYDEANVIYRVLGGEGVITTDDVVSLSKLIVGGVK